MILSFDRYLDTIPDLQFLQNIGHVVFDGFFPQIQSPSDWTCTAKVESYLFT